MTTFEDSAQGGSGLDIDIPYYLSVLRRRFWLFFAVWVLIAALGVGVAYVLPPVYEARALILVESQQISTDLVRSTITAPVSERIAIIRQRLLTRDTLFKLLKKHGVFNNRSDMSPNDKVTAMREAVQLKQLALDPGARWNRSQSSATVFSVSFTGDNGAIAAAMVNDMVTRILQQNAQLRKSRAETTASFFAQEAERLSRELIAVESKILTFMQENEESLPDSLDYRREQLDLLQERARSLELRKLELQQERSSLTFILDSVESPAQSEMERALEAARRELFERSALLSAEHPVIRSLRSRVAAYEAAFAAEQAAKSQSAADGAALAAPPSPAAVEARRRLAFIDAQFGYIDAQLAKIDDERAALQRSILATPSVEIALNALQRVRRETEDRHQIARAKLAEARTGEQLEDKQQGERFEVIEQAVVPEKPIRPNRVKISLLGIAGGFAAGIGLILLLEMMSGVVRRAADLDRIRRQPLAMLPYIVTPNEHRRLWAGRIAALLLVFGGGAAALWAMDVYYLPLEVVAQKLLEKSKLDGVIETIRLRFN